MTVLGNQRYRKCKSTAWKMEIIIPFQSSPSQWPVVSGSGQSSLWRKREGERKKESVSYISEQGTWHIVWIIKYFHTFDFVSALYCNIFYLNHNNACKGKVLTLMLFTVQQWGYCSCLFTESPTLMGQKVTELVKIKWACLMVSCKSFAINNRLKSMTHI